ncbi:MAG TPA: SDR family NAD(P)-dependent oxidoreductase [Streptosporangiaceae bacterium]|nr:SDR family NAD(P)-dependent oxidoreductase [Streptosporangiaceae bacterium]
MRISGATVLITGASSGIGAATAHAVAAAGGRPVLTGRNAERLAAVAAQTGGVSFVADVTERVDVDTEVAGPVDVLVNNAGVGWAGPFGEMTEADIERLIAVNLTAPIRLTRALVPGMVERGRGHIVFVASIAGATGVRHEAVYSATKAGLIYFADSLRYELAGSGVGVSVVLPGVVDTPFFDRRGRPYERRRPAPIPAGRVARTIVAAIERDRAEAYQPGWMRIPARLRGGAPTLFRRLAGRFG